MIDVVTDDHRHIQLVPDYDRIVECEIRNPATIATNY